MRAGRRELCALLDQQCWVWGQDVQRAEGNLLLRYGMERRRAPEGVVGCSQYSAVAEGMEVRVWGFGVFFGCGAGVYLNRFEGVARWAEALPAFCVAKEMGRLPRGSRTALLARGMRWMAGYERWVLAEVGVGYRRRCLEARGKVAAAEPEGVPGRWEGLARAAEDSAVGQRGVVRVRRP